MGKTILIAVVVALVVGGAAAYGGYKMGDAAGFERANQVRQQFAASRQNTSAQGSQAQGGQTQGGPGQFNQGGLGSNRSLELQGVVKSVDGNKMTVTIGQRDVTVTLTDKTMFLKSVTGTRADLTAGARVALSPEAGSAMGGGAAAAGNVNVASVTLLPPQ